MIIPVSLSLVFYQLNTVNNKAGTLDVDSELSNFIQKHDASIEEIVKEILQIKRTIGHMSQVLTDAFAGVRGDAQNRAILSGTRGIAFGTYGNALKFCLIPKPTPYLGSCGCCCSCCCCCC